MTNFANKIASEKSAYDNEYKEKLSSLIECNTQDEYIEYFEQNKISPFYISGNTKGYVRGVAVLKLLNACNKLNTERKIITVLDAGCGLGELSVYLACKGFHVIGVDISTKAINSAKKLAKQFSVDNRCTFLFESLESLSLPNQSVDYIIGHASLHHFIKYELVPQEFYRIMKVDSLGFFADSFGENKLFHLFHNKERMSRLGDVILTKNLITNYFDRFSLELIPTDWFVMLDKLYLKLFPKRFLIIQKYMSYIHFKLDRKISALIGLDILLHLSGSVITIIKKDNN